MSGFESFLLSLFIAINIMKPKSQITDVMDDSEFDAKSILQQCLTSLSRDSVGRDDIYKFFMPIFIGTTIAGVCKFVPTEEQREQVSNLFLEVKENL